MPQIQVLIYNQSSWFMNYYSKLVEKFNLAINKSNLLIHASDFSKNRRWAPET